MTEVAIIKGINPIDTTVKALEAIKAQNHISREKPILIKPNYINAQHPSTGITTDGRVIEGIAKFLRQYHYREIMVGEGSGFSDTFKAFKAAGVDALAERWNLELVDLNKDHFMKVNSPNPLTLKRIKVARTALESTIISVPKLKTHRLAGVSLSLKNMMGTVIPKGSLHYRLSHSIADLASIVKPSLAVIDGVIAGEGHETSGNPVKMNLVISGIDPVAVDSVGTAVMKIPLNEVKHLRLAEKKGLGTCRLDQIKIIGEPIERTSREFRRSILSKLLVHLS